MDENLRREIIMDNYQEPFHRGLVNDDNYQKINTNSESCIDNLDFMIKINDNVIEDLRFDGESCAISTAASSILLRKLIGKDIDEAKKILINYKNMIYEKEYNEDILGELNAFCEIYKQPNRTNCAMMPEFAIEKLLEGLSNGQYKN